MRKTLDAYSIEKYQAFYIDHDPSSLQIIRRVCLLPTLQKYRRTNTRCV